YDDNVVVENCRRHGVTDHSDDGDVASLPIPHGELDLALVYSWPRWYRERFCSRGVTLRISPLRLEEHHTWQVPPPPLRVYAGCYQSTRPPAASRCGRRLLAAMPPSE